MNSTGLARFLPERTADREKSAQQINANSSLDSQAQRRILNAIEKLEQQLR
ncbi:MAG: hypothetical protein OQK49_05875 [Proteobacteria bacterium]|nr:hypothetical protein [Pseudomonadota bacterium]